MALVLVRAKIDGVWTGLTYNNATGRYEGYYTATRTSFHQPGGYFNVEIEASNSAGSTARADGSVFDGLRLVCQEIVAPGLTLISPLPGYVTVKRPTVVLEAVDEPGGSGINPGSFAVTLDGAPQSSEKASSTISGGYRLTWTPAADLSEGHHLVTFSVSDNDGNPASVSAAYTVDTVPPSLWVSKPGWNRVVDVEQVCVRVQAWDLTSGPPSVWAVNNGRETAMVKVPPAAGELYDVYEGYVPLDVGENDITVTARDGAGWETRESIYMIRLVDDRTQADVTRLKALFSRPMEDWTQDELEWFKSAQCLRGSYDKGDVNRVGLAVQYLSDMLNERFGFSIPVNVRTNWSCLDAPVRTLMAALLADVERVKSAQDLAELNDLLLPESIRFLNFLGANQIEYALVRTDDPFDRYTWWTSGEASSGE